MTALMQGKRGLVMGVANNRSIAWGIAQAAHAQGAARDGRLCGEILVGERIAGKPHVDAGLRAQLRARLDHLFALHDAAVSFHTARPLSDVARKLGLLSSKDFLHGRPRADQRALRNSWGVRDVFIDDYWSSPPRGPDCVGEGADNPGLR